MTHRGLRRGVRGLAPQCHMYPNVSSHIYPVTEITSLVSSHFQNYTEGLKCLIILSGVFEYFLGTGLKCLSILSLHLSDALSERQSKDWHNPIDSIMFTAR